jgi:arsenate reductase-like glutaredoxin family protein
MNIQIFGKAKCFDTQKAQRYFKERKIKFQYIDLIRYGISLGEYQSVKRALGGMRPMIDEKSRDYEASFIAYLGSETAIEQKLLDNPNLIKTPIVRNGKQATIGYCPDIWKNWE